MYKERGDDKFYTGPVWDCDIAFDNDSRTHTELNNPTGYLYSSGTASFAGGNNMQQFVTRIVKLDPVANARLKEMWAELRNSGVITPESLVQWVNDTEQYLDQSQKLQYTRWGNLHFNVNMNYQALGSYPAEVDVVRMFINRRVTDLDKIINK
jgi:hypothetical protein